MKTVQDYLKHAAECEALARKALTSEEREALRHMAHDWRELAQTRKKALVSKESKR